MPPVTWLFWFYLAAGGALLGYVGVLLVAYWIRRQMLVAWLAALLWWIAVDVLVRALMRSPQALVPYDWLLMAARAAVTLEVLFGWLVVDAYLAAFNGHLNIVRRMWYWWNKRKGDQAWEET